MPKLRRHTSAHKGRDVRVRTDRFDRRQVGCVEFDRARVDQPGLVGLHTGVLTRSRLGLVRDVCLFALRFFMGGLALAPRPAINEIFAIVHLRSSRPDGPRRASASGSARSRFLFTNSRSTWCSATKAAIVSCIEVGIATVSTTLAPASVMASPSAGSAVTDANSYGGSPSTGRNVIHSSGVPRRRLSL